MQTMETQSNANAIKQKCMEQKALQSSMNIVPARRPVVEILSFPVMLCDLADHFSSGA